MEAYYVPDQGLADTYLIQGSEPYPQSAAQFELYESSMYNEGAPDYIVDQGLYYPSGTSYGYICAGYEPTTEWDDQSRFFGLDAQDIHYTVAANDSVPYVYYPPNYGFAQSPYNPYNPYIPGAVIGPDGSIMSPQHYYALPSYETPATSAAYLPVVLPQRPNVAANGIMDLRGDATGSINKADGLGSKHNSAQPTLNASLTAAGDASSRKHSFAKMSEGGRVNMGTGKQHLPTSTSGGITSQIASRIPQIRGAQGLENGLRGKASVASSQLKTAFTSGNGTAFESGSYAQPSVNKIKPNMLSGRAPDDERVGTDTLIEQNRESRMSKSKNHLVVKAYTTRAGNPDAQGNIIISIDQYNKVDFPVEYANAKFFVIKSYSEDDVHKSIKYNVWSSTPNGNRKLNAAYEDAKKISAGGSRGCPIFLFFSVNASGQFCGVAEMTGPVDFHRDMDFWQQDKWSGSFSVKWRFIKDLPNPNFRHIILENNENKPVTNSRDTQEISYNKGLDMLKIFKNYTSKTSLLDDFMYYENRQRILHGERARISMKSYENPYLVPLLDPPRKLQPVHDFPLIRDANGVEHDSNNLKGNAKPKAETPSGINPNLASVPASCQDSAADGMPNAADELKISGLSLCSDERTVPTTAVSNKTNSETANVVTIGSMPVKVTDAESSGFLTVGTIPLDPKNLVHE